jgi:hypothetical protein
MRWRWVANVDVATQYRNQSLAQRRMRSYTHGSPPRYTYQGDRPMRTGDRALRPRKRCRWSKNQDNGATQRRARTRRRRTSRD